MLAQPSMIKRPVLELDGKLLVGFKPEIYVKEVAARSAGSLEELGQFVCEEARGHIAAATCSTAPAA